MHAESVSKVTPGRWHQSRQVAPTVPLNVPLTATLRGQCSCVHRSTTHPDVQSDVRGTPENLPSLGTISDFRLSLGRISTHLEHALGKRIELAPVTCRVPLEGGNNLRNLGKFQVLENRDDRDP